jgi:hypothetical protein
MMDQTATRRFLLEAARKIDGDKLLIALDADEFFTGDFVDTNDKKKIMNSELGDPFCWWWINLKRNDIRNIVC